MEETIIFGRKPILDALQSDRRFDKIMVLKSSQSPELEEISKLARQKKVVLQAVPKEKIEDVL